MIIFNRKTLARFFILPAIISAITITTAIKGFVGERYLNELSTIPPREGASAEINNAETQKKILAQGAKLKEIWFNREKIDAVPILLKLLPELTGEHERFAIRALGRMEDPRALTVLSKVKKQTENDVLSEKMGSENALTNVSQGRVFPTLPLALGRIKARNLDGEKKLDYIASSVGLKWPQVVILSSKALPTRRQRDLGQSSGAEIVAEFVDVLHEMGKSGEDTRPFVKGLALSPAATVKLKLASLPDDQEILSLLDYACGSEGNNLGAPYLIEKQLLGMGQRARASLVSRVKEMCENPTKYHLGETKLTYYAIFDGAALTGDHSLIPLFKKLEKFARDRARKNGGEGYTYLEEDAYRARESLENDRLYSPFPSP